MNHQVKKLNKKVKLFILFASFVLGGLVILKYYLTGGREGLVGSGWFFLLYGTPLTFVFGIFKDIHKFTILQQVLISYILFAFNVFVLSLVIVTLLNIKIKKTGKALMLIASIIIYIVGYYLMKEMMFGDFLKFIQQK